MDIVAFGDFCWWEKHREQVCNTYDGPVVSTSDQIKGDPRVRWIQRRGSGLYRTKGVAWNTNTGAMSINLALRFGAKVVILLGYDMGLGGKQESNWHPNLVSHVTKDAYRRFRTGFTQLANDLPVKFPGCVVLNANLKSGLDNFPKISREQALELY